MYPFREANVPLGLHVPQVWNLCNWWKRATLKKRCRLFLHKESKLPTQWFGAVVPFHNSIIYIIRHFMVYQIRLETNLLQLFAHPENSGWFSIISVIIFEVNVAAEQKQAHLVTIFLFCKSFHYPLLFLLPSCSTARPAIRGWATGQLPPPENISWLWPCPPEMITIQFAGWISGRIVSLQPDTDIQ